MGQPGAKKSDQIVSSTPGDVHIIMVPSPGGPVPTPIPHPCVSIIKDKVADKVKVMGQPGAVKGSISKHSPPHVPMGPGPFQKPPKNKGKIVTASSNVFYEGKEAAMLGDTAEMCADPADAPVGMVMGSAATVEIGGGGQGSDAARAAAADQAMAAAAAACHRWINANMPPGADREKAHRDVCTATGHPIDVATGKMFTRSIELRLRGRIPLQFVRNYSSARPDLGPMGRGWRHSFETQLFVHADFVAHRDANGRYLEFAPIALGESSRNELSRASLRRTAAEYVLETPDGYTQSFDMFGPQVPCGDGAVAWPLASIADAAGNLVRFEHRSDGRIAKIIDSAGRIVLIEYDGRGLIVTLRLSQGRAGDVPQVVRRYEYENDLLMRSIDATGAAVQYEYAGHSLLVRETDASGFSFYFTYDAEGWCRETWGDGGLLYRRLEYDRSRRRTRVIDSFGRATTYEWTEAGVVTRETDPEGHAWDFGYNESLQQVQARDPLGHVWSYEYDAQGNLLSTADPEGNSSQYAYDDQGRRIRYTDRAGNDWTWGYAPDGRAIRMRGPLGYGTGIVRDARGDVTHIANRHDAFHRLEYNERGDLVRRLDASGLDVWRTHTPAGDLQTEFDQFGRRLELTYDDLGRIRSRWERDKGRLTFERDPEGRIVTVTDEDGRRHDYEWCNLNRVRRVHFPEVTLASGDTVRPIKAFDYDSENRLTAVHLPGGETVRYEYATHLQRPTRVTYADGRVQDVGRNPRGFVTSLTENGQLVFRQDVDSAGRVIRRLTGDGEEVTFEYDPLGRLAVAESDACSVAVTRDGLGRVIAEAWDHGTVGHAYDEPDAFRRMTVTTSDIAEEDTDDFVTELVRKGSGALQVRVAGRDAGEIVYDPLSRLQLLSCGPAGRGARVETRFGNSALPLERRVAGAADEQIRADKYAYDAGGRLLSTTRSDRAGHTPRPDYTTRYRRDGLGRLSEECVEIDAGAPRIPERRVSWQYDAKGNRVRVRTQLGANDDAAVVDDHRYLEGNRLTTGDGVELSYDERGRVVARREADGRVTRFTWNALNRLRHVHLPDGSALRMTYDPLGRRVAVDGPDGVTRFLYNGDNLVHETRPDGAQRHYMYASGSFRPIMCFDRTADAAEWTESLYVTDPRGCPEALIGPDGQVRWDATVGPWGERTATPSDEDIHQPLLLPGQYVDAAAGIAYNRARYYMPDLGTYLSPDPIGLDGGDHPYAYADDPICWIDPLGLSNADYTPPSPEALACGPLQAPWMTRDGELTMTDDIRVVLPGYPMVLDLNETDRYLYAIGPDGTVYYSPQTPQGVEFEIVKHTTLAGKDPNNPSQARPMRVAGEIKYDEDSGQWVMDGASGRYSYDGNTNQETRTPENVAAAAHLANAEPGGTPVVASPHVFPPQT
jgi:RHS repeat-associated protein